MTSEPARPEPAASERKSPVRFLLTVLLALIAVDLVAYLIFPPFDPTAAVTCSYPVCFINGTLELPAPHVVWPAGHHPDPTQIVTWDISITSSLLTMWIVAVVILVVFFILTRGRQLVPHPRQNFAEWVYEPRRTSPSRWAVRRRDRTSRCSSAFFLFILVSNWSGLDPAHRPRPVPARAHERRERHHRAGARGLAVSSSSRASASSASADISGSSSRSASSGRDRRGRHRAVRRPRWSSCSSSSSRSRCRCVCSATSIGGEVALGVITALTIAIVPIGLYALEVMLNLVQALIFSTLTLMFTLAPSRSTTRGARDEREPHGTPVRPAALLVAAPAH